MEKFTEKQIRFLQEMLTHNTKMWEERANKMFVNGETNLHQYCVGFYGACKRLKDFTNSINKKFEEWEKWTQHAEM